MAVAAKSRNSLEDIYLESLMLNKLFSNFKLQKHQRILLFCFRKRIQVNDKIAEIIL